MKGQFKVEFILGVVSFGIFILFVVSQLNAMYSNSVLETKTDSLRANAVYALEFLVNDKNGLASNPHNLSRDKISDFYSSNCTTLDEMGLERYQLTIISSDSNLTCETNIPDSTNIRISKPVLIEGENANITLVTWI